MIPLNTIFTYFETGDFPTQEQFQQTFLSFRHKADLIPVEQVAGLASLFSHTLNASAFEIHLEDTNAHADFLAKRNADNLDATNIAEWKNTLGITEIATIDVPGENGNVYDKTQIDNLIDALKDVDTNIFTAINALEDILTSDDLSLDELQEIVSYVKENRADIEALQNATIGTVDDVDVLITNSIHGYPVTNQQEMNIAFAANINALESVPGNTRYETTVSASGIVTHNLNTYDVDVILYDTGTRYNADGRIYRPTTNTIEIFFDTEPTNPIKVIVKAI